MTKQQPDKNNIPFEPSSKAKKPKLPIAKPKALDPKTSAESSDFKVTATTIPPEVNKRMVRRSAVFCGIPTSMGIGTFFLSYAIAANHWAELPNSAVVLVSMGCMGLGVLGLSYGALSASWDENRDGNWWGWQEFKQNFGYLTAAWKQQKAEKARSEKLSTQKSD